MTAIKANIINTTNTTNSNSSKSIGINNYENNVKNIDQFYSKIDSNSSKKDMTITLRIMNKNDF